MRVSLRVSVISLVATANLAVFGGGLAWVTSTAVRQQAQLEAAYDELLELPLGMLLESEGRVNAPALLRWPHWHLFEDAIILQLPDVSGEAERPTGPVGRTPGLWLNPVGSGRRRPTFDEPAIMADIRLAAWEGRAVSTRRGLALPVHLPSGEPWGGAWVLKSWGAGAQELFLSLLPWFLVSTLLLTLITFTTVRRLVLDPVRELARGARSIASGRLGVRVAERARRDELSELVGDFNAMAQQVEDYNAHLAEQVARATRQAREAEAAAMTQRRLAATGELAAGIAHEINNPLGGMLNAVEVLEREDLPAARRRQYHELLAGGLQRIGEIVGRVLRLAPRAAKAGTVRLVEPLSDALGLVRHRAADQGVDIVLHGEGGRRALDGADALAPYERLPTIDGEGNELGQAFLNLLVNSLDALESRAGGGAQGRGRIDVTLERRGSELFLCVADDGPGMEPEVLERAADLFFTTKETGRGTGLGLAIVHNVVAAHGGRVLLKSEPGGGLEVEIHLPIERSPARPVERPAGGSGAGS